MNQAQLRRLAGVAGIGFVIVIVIQFIFGPGDPPGFDEPAEEVAGFVGDNRGELRAAAALTVVAGPLFLVFLAGLARELRVAEGRGPAMLAAARSPAGSCSGRSPSPGPGCSGRPPITAISTRG